MGKPLKILFLFHMHQPLYRLQVNGKSKYSLPWVFMYGIKEYYDVARVLDESEVKVTINFVPSLLVQIEDYKDRRAEDEFLKILKKDADELSDSEKVFILKNFFAAHPERQIGLSKRYKMLYDKRGTPYDLDKKIGRFTTQEWRDLQVHFLLAYMSEYVKREDAHVRELIKKDSSFTEEEKLYLIDRALEVIKEVVPLYKNLLDSGKIEISTSPFYHPLLPLVIDTEIAHEVHPLMELPRRRFRDREGAKEQIDRALKFMEKTFGKRPKGIWPPEGALSKKVLSLFKEVGIDWTVTDEALLERALGIPLRENRKVSPDLYRIYEYGGIKLFFRDRNLSDRIGFVYGRWKTDRAVDDLMESIMEVYREGGDVLVLAFDGENPWVNYEDGGIPFLKSLFRRLSLCERAKTFTFSELMEEKAFELRKFYPGSWIAGSFSAWIGHPEKNRAWEYLADVKNDLARVIKSNEDVKEEFMVAEGSDWFWWYGEDHPTIYSEEFDMLFREHLKECYRIAGVTPPPFLDVPIAQLRRETLKRSLVGTLSPTIDGRVTNYFEWLPAGEIDLKASVSGVMERPGASLTSLFFGVDDRKLYLRIDGEKKFKDLLSEHNLRIRFYRPPSTLWELEIGIDKDVRVKMIRRERKRVEEVHVDLEIAVDRILELSLPLKLFDDINEIELAIELLKGDLLIERYPFSGYFVISPLKMDPSLYWMV